MTFESKVIQNEFNLLKEEYTKWHDCFRRNFDEKDKLVGDEILVAVALMRLTEYYEELNKKNALEGII